MTSREPRFTPRQQGGPEHHPVVLGQRVDAAYFAFQGKLRPDFRQRVEARRAEGLALKVETAVELLTSNEGELRGALSTRSRDGWWTIQSAWLRVVVDERASHDWLVEVKPSALLLMREGPQAALGMARAAARAVLDPVTGERLRRLDLCADMTGFDLADVAVPALITHHRTRVADISTVKQYWRVGKRTGFVVGKGDAVARIYDKTEHLALGLDETKADDERSEWHHGGWNGRDDVTRVEFQLRSRLLDEFDVRDPEAAFARLDAIWSYCTGNWLRLVVPGTATRKERCATDPRWQVLRDVVFRARSEPAKRRRAPATPHARRMLSATVNYCACAGVLAERVGDARTVVAGWSNPRSEAWVHEEHFAMAKITAHASAVDLLSRFDEPRDAAAHLMEKQNAARMKFTGTSSCEAGAATAA